LAIFPLSIVRSVVRFPLPRPQLNPDEVVWAHVKRHISRRLVQNKDEMKELALSVLYRIQKLPELAKSFFRQPECLYIKM